MLNSLLDEDPQMERGTNYVLIQDEPTNPNPSTLSVEVPDAPEDEDRRNKLEEAISYRQSFMALPFAMQIFVAIGILGNAIFIVFGVIPVLFYFVYTLITAPFHMLPSEHYWRVFSVLLFWVLVWKALCTLVYTKFPLDRLPFNIYTSRRIMMCLYVVLTYTSTLIFLDDGNMDGIYAFFLVCMLLCVIMGLFVLMTWVLQDKPNLDDFCEDEDKGEDEDEETLNTSNEEHAISRDSLLQRAKDGQPNYSRKYYVGIAGLLLLACVLIIVTMTTSEFHIPRLSSIEQVICKYRKCHVSLPHLSLLSSEQAFRSMFLDTWLMTHVVIWSAVIGIYILLYRIVSVQNHSML